MILEDFSIILKTFSTFYSLGMRWLLRLLAIQMVVALPTKRNGFQSRINYWIVMINDYHICLVCLYFNPPDTLAALNEEGLPSGSAMATVLNNISSSLSFSF